MDLLPDQLDLLSVFHAHGFRFTEPRYVNDLDVRVSVYEANGQAVYRAFAEFEASLARVTATDFINNPKRYFQIRVPSGRVDVLQSIAAVEFEAAWKQATTVESNARDVVAAGRPKDLVDAEELRKYAKGT
jgi:hypothetical protein